MLKGMGYNQVIEARHGGEALDYLRSAEMGNSTSAITKHLKFSGKWIKLLLLLQLPGDGIILARLLYINKSSDFSVFIICETLAEIHTPARYALDRLGAFLPSNATA